MSRLFALLCFALPAFAGEILPPAPRLPAPKGKVVQVDNERKLQRAVRQAKDGTTILIAPGTYRLSNTLHLRGVTGVAIRGVRGAKPVTLLGQGMDVKAPSVPHGIMLTDAKDVLIADLRIGEVQDHPVMIQPTCARPRLYNLELFDAGEQFVKASSGGGGKGVDGGRVEYCRLYYREVGPKNGYTNGVDVHGGDGWVIRHCSFRNIRVPKGAQYKHVPAILMWNGAADTIAEGNVFVDCERAIAFGLSKKSGFNDHKGGIIRNNMIAVSDKVEYADAAIVVWDSPGTRILHNTILMNGRYPNAIELRYATSKDVVIRGNLHDAKVGLRDGATATESDNHDEAVAAMFRDAAKGDLHLRGRVRGVVAMIRTSKDCPLDFDGDKRGRGADLGADQFGKKKKKKKRKR